MFGFSMGEILLLGAIALIAIGPKQLPEVARTIGKLLNELRRMSVEVQRAMNETHEETTRTFTDMQKSLDSALLPKASSTPAEPGAVGVAQSGQENQPALDEHQQMSFEIGKKES